MKIWMIFPLCSSLFALAVTAVAFCASSRFLHVPSRAMSGTVYSAVGLVLITKFLHERMLRLFALSRTNSKERSRIHCLNLLSALIGFIGPISVVVAHASNDPFLLNFGLLKPPLRTAMEITGCTSAVLYCLLQAHLARLLQPELCSRRVVNVRRTLAVFVTLLGIAVIVFGNVLLKVASSPTFMRLSQISDGILRYVLVAIVCIFLLTFTHEFNKSLPNPIDRTGNIVVPQPIPKADTKPDAIPLAVFEH